MNRPKLSAAALCVTSLAPGALFAVGSTGPPDTILFDGSIFTADASNLHVEALAIRGDRIVAIGDSAAIRALSAPQTRLIDLGGHTVIPGINDAHQHLAVMPPGLIGLHLKSRDPTWPEVRDAIQAAVRSGGPGRTIVATVSGVSTFGHKRSIRWTGQISP